MTSRYRSLPLEQQGLWLEEVQLGLGLWQGSYQGVERLWLRWYDAQGNWMPTPAEQEAQRAQQQQQRVKINLTNLSSHRNIID